MKDFLDSHRIFNLTPQDPKIGALKSRKCCYVELLLESTHPKI